MKCLCVPEFSTSSGSGEGSLLYTQCYRSSGELPAFVVAWSWLLAGAAQAAAAAKTIVLAIDYVCEAKMSTFFAAKLGQWFSMDFPAATVASVPVLMALLGLRTSSWVSRTSLAVGLVGGGIFIVLGALHVELDPPWSPREFIPTDPVEFLSSISICMAIFVSHLPIGGLDRPVVSSPALLSVATGASTIIAYSMYSCVAIVLSLMVHHRDLPSGTALLQAFEIRDVNWARYVMVTITIFSLFISILDFTSPLHRTLQRMAADGLVFRCLATKWPFTSAPIAAIALNFSIMCILIFTVSLTPLIQIIACGHLVVNFVICIHVLHRRYQPVDPWEYEPMSMVDTADEVNNGSPIKNHRKGKCPVPCSVQNGKWISHDLWAMESNASPSPSQKVVKNHPTNNNIYNELVDEVTNSNAVDSDNSSDTDIDAIVEEYKDKIRVATLTHMQSSDSGSEGFMEPTDFTGRRVTFAVFGLVSCFCVLDSLFIMVCYERLEPRSFVFLICLCLFSLFAFLCLLVICRQPQAQLSSGNQQDVASFRTPLVPWSIACIILINLFLIMQLLISVWIPFLTWMGLGLLVYVGYGIRHSVEANFFDRLVNHQEQIQLQPLPKHPVVSRLIPSHRKRSRDKKPLLSQPRPRQKRQPIISTSSADGEKL